MRSADSESAVSPTCSRRGADRSERARAGQRHAGYNSAIPTFAALRRGKRQIENLRYPFGEPAEKVPAWLTAKFDRFDKPYAMVETNEASDRLVFPKSKIVIQGTPEKQTAYLRTLLSLAERRRFQFVVLFIHRDCDALWEKIKGTAPELFIACGIADCSMGADRRVRAIRCGANTSSGRGFAERTGFFVALFSPSALSFNASWKLQNLFPSLAYVAPARLGFVPGS